MAQIYTSVDQLIGKTPLPELTQLEKRDGSKAKPEAFNPASSVKDRVAKAMIEDAYEDMNGEVDLFVAGVGTGGTITGVGSYLKSKKPSIRVVAVEPAASAVLSGKAAGAHGLQGMGAGFIPEMLQTEVIDEVIAVTEEQAYAAGRLISTNEGILVGISAGAAAHAAMELARRKENEGKRIVVLFPDTGDRYLSAPLFAE